MPLHSNTLRTLAVLAILATPTSVESQGSPPIKRFVGAPDVYCTHVPFKNGFAVQSPSGSIAQAGKWQTGDWIVKEVLYPTVQYPKGQPAITAYNDVFIPAKTQVTVEACGCVQTGGKGLTWKRYVDPQGDNSGRLYHGAIRIPGARAMGLPVSPVLGGDFVRIQDLMKAQRSGFRWQTTQGAPLLLGYEDDDTSDNSYSDHDNGTGDQCKGVFAAAARVLLQAM